MPLPEELRKSLDSEIADLSNIGDRYGGMLVAGVFLQEFVPDAHAVGAPRRRRAGVEPGRGPRLHAEGRRPVYRSGRCSSGWSVAPAERRMVLPLSTAER